MKSQYLNQFSSSNRSSNDEARPTNSKTHKQETMKYILHIKTAQAQQWLH